MNNHKNNPQNQAQGKNTHDESTINNQLNNNQVGRDVHIQNTKQDQVKGDKVTINNVKLGGVFGVLGILTVAIFTMWHSNTKNDKQTVKPAKPKQQNIPCVSQKTDFRVDVAHFHPQRPSFAVKLVSKIKEKVPTSVKSQVAVEKYNDYFFNKAKPAFEVNKLIAKTCQYKGLVVYGDRNAQAGEKSLTCWIDIINLKKRESHQLEEPPSSFKFSIPHHARYVAYFVSGLIKYYLNLNDEAAQDFNNFLQQVSSVPTAQKKQVVAYCKVYLGKIALENGYKIKALALFKEANQLNPSDFNTKNILKLSKITSGNETTKSETANENDGQVKGVGSTSLEVASIHRQESLPIVLREALKNPEKTEKLDFRTFKLSKVPEQVAQLVNIKKLYFTHSKLTTLPSFLSQLTKLTHLYCRYNQIEQFPQVLTYLPYLKGLYLRGNRLTNIPTEIKQMTALISLDLRNNQLTHLPPEIAELKNLRRLYLTHNPISDKHKKEIIKWLPKCDVTFKEK